jgi:hypothetical protein
LLLDKFLYCCCDVCWLSSKRDWNSHRVMLINLGSNVSRDTYFLPAEWEYIVLLVLML